MLEGLLLHLVGFIAAWKGIHVQTHATPCLHWHSGFGINDGVPTLGSLNQFGVLFFQDCEVLLSLPGPDAVGREYKVHLFKCALVGFRVQAIDHGKRDHVGNAKDVVSLLSESLEHDWQDECEPAISDRPAHDTPGVSFGPDFQWKDFSGVEPGNSEPRGTESCCEEEDHSHGP